MAVYTISIIEFDDVTPAFSTTDTVGSSVVGQTFSIASGATPIAIQVDDDDLDFDDGFIDPPGNSTGANNQLIAEPVTINGNSYGPATMGGTPTDQIELEFAFTTTDGDSYYVVRINGVNVGLSGATLPQAGQTFTISAASDGVDTPYDDIPCFADGTLILTPDGPVAVENLTAGDRVETFDNGPQPLLDVTSTRLSENTLRSEPNLRPIVFQPGIFGNTREMRLSPQHRVLVRGWNAELHFGEPQVLAPAKALLNGKTVTVERPHRAVTYFHLLFEDHQLVFSDGAVTESLYPGFKSDRDDHAEGLKELSRLFGPDFVSGGRPRFVRPVLSVREATTLAGL